MPHSYQHCIRIVSILLMSVFYGSVSAYVYVWSDDIGFLEKKDSAYTVLSDKDIFFYPQAPLWNWEKHMESCEEASASVLWRNSFQMPKISPVTFDSEIDAINALEEKYDVEKMEEKLRTWKKKWYLRDLSLEEISDWILERYFHMSSDDIFILENPTIENIEKLLNNNFMILAPINTWEVHNPYVRHVGYHIIPMIGYNETSFTTLDVATKKGFKLPFEKELFMSSLRNNGNNILFINSHLAHFSDLKREDIMKRVNRKASLFENELTKRLRPLSSEKQREILQKVNKVLIQKIKSAPNDEKKMTYNMFRIIVERLLK